MSGREVEAFLCKSDSARKSQQYFLKDGSNDTVLKRGPGCNVVQRRCFIIDQEKLNENALEQIRDGKLL